MWEPDKDKKYFYDELYPTNDDWQVIRDLEVLNVLSDNNDNPNKGREVFHWAYFKDEDRK